MDNKDTEKEKGGKQETTETCCYVTDPCGCCYVADPCYAVDACGCRYVVDPCCC